MKMKYYYREWSEVECLKNIGTLSKEFTLLFFRELNPNYEQERKIHFKTITGIHYFEFKIKNEGVKSRWRKMEKIAKHKDFIGWIPPTDKMVRRLKLKMLQEIK